MGVAYFTQRMKVLLPGRPKINENEVQKIG